jgi:hypothetical protein
MRLSRASIALLLIQLAIVSSIAAKYLYQRWTCPKVWTRAVAYDPELVMRGRYLSMQLHVDACGVQLPPPVKGADQHDVTTLFDQNGVGMPYIDAFIGVRNNKLAVLALDESGNEKNTMAIQLRRGETCDKAMLTPGIDFYISETAKSPFPLAKGSELWVEVTVPPKGPPRPIAMATKDSEGHWQPLNYR